MAITVARLQAVLSANTDDFDRGMDRSHKAITGFAKTAGIALGVAGVAGVVGVLKTGWDEFNDSVKVTAQTNAVLKSTGSIAGVTSKQVQSLAGAIMRKSGIDDEAVQSGENLLLTFTNVRNEVGRGNNIFDQATKTMADMSTALGQDVKSSAIQLGKALNDPIKGVTALQRVGVSFTKDQREQIKALVDSGRTMDAQKVILAELNKEFGGSAEAMGKTLPGQINILREQFKNAAGDIVGTMVPALLKVTSWIQVHGPEIKAVISAAVNGIKAAFTTVLIPATQLVVNTIREHWAQISATVKGVMTTIQAVVRDVTAAVQVIWRNFGDQITTIVRAAFNTALTIVRTVLLNIRDVIRLIGDVIHGRWGEVWDDIRGIVGRTLGAIVQILQNGVKILGAAASILANAAWLAMRDKVNDIVGFWRDMPGRVAAAISAGAGAVKDAVEGIFSGLPGAVKRLLGISSPSKVFAEIGANIVHGVVAGIESQAGNLKDKALGMLGDVASVVKGAAGAIPGGAGSSGLILDVLEKFAAGEGITVTSTTGGQHAANSYHYQGRAIDVAGSYSAMVRFFRDAQATFGSSIKELFFDPIGYYIKNGQVVRGAIGGHSDHVHLALAQGGIVTRPTTALIGEAGPEAVIPLSRSGGAAVSNTFVFPNYVGSKNDLVQWLKQALQRDVRFSGGMALG